MDIWSTTLNPRPASFQILVVDCSIDICRGGGLLKKAAYQGANYILSSLQEMEGKIEDDDLLVEINFNYTGNFNTSTTHNCSHKQNYTKTTLQRLDIEPGSVA